MLSIFIEQKPTNKKATAIARLPTTAGRKRLLQIKPLATKLTRRYSDFCPKEKADEYAKEPADEVAMTASYRGDVDRRARCEMRHFVTLVTAPDWASS